LGVTYKRENSDGFIHANIKLKTHGICHFLCPNFVYQKAGEISGFGICAFGWRQKPNMALNQDARNAGFGLRWPARSRLLARRWAL
jgi:hypothetical protein